MMNESTSQPQVVMARLSKLCGLASGLVGCVVMVGWALKLESLKSVVPGLATMKANTALAFVLSGFAIWYLQPEPVRGKRRLLVAICASVIASLGLLTMMEYLLGWDLGIDQLVFQEAVVAMQTVSPGRMAPITSLSFLAFGLSLVLLDGRVSQRLSGLLLLVPILSGVLASVGYLYSVRALYSVGGLNSMALHTAFMFIVIGVGVWCARPHRGLLALVLSQGVAGGMVRRLLPTAVLLPIGLGWLRLQGQRIGWYGTEFGIALFALSNVVVFVVLIVVTARVLSQIDARRNHAETALKEHVATEEERVIERTQALAAQRLAALNLAHDAEEARQKTAQSEAELQHRQKLMLSLLEDVQAAREQFVSANKELEQEIAERKRAEGEIAAKSKELETLLYVTSHDLTEPLRSIENFSQMLLDEHGECLDEEGQDLLRRVVKGGTRMHRLLNDILALSRVRRMTSPTEEVQVEVIVREALDGLTARIQETKAKVQVAKDLPRFRVDRTWATQVLYNLVSNALKFTKPGESPDVEIAAYRPAPGDSNGGEGFVVRDRGPGVAPEHVERIFNLFERAVGHEVEGTGAGLAIVRAVAERHGGKTWVRPREGGGSEFIVTFGKKPG